MCLNYIDQASTELLKESHKTIAAYKVIRYLNGKCYSLYKGSEDFFVNGINVHRGNDFLFGEGMEEYVHYEDGFHAFLNKEDAVDFMNEGVKEGYETREVLKVIQIDIFSSDIICAGRQDGKRAVVTKRMDVIRFLNEE